MSKNMLGIISIGFLMFLTGCLGGGGDGSVIGDSSIISRNFSTDEVQIFAVQSPTANAVNDLKNYNKTYEYQKYYSRQIADIVNQKGGYKDQIELAGRISGTSEVQALKEKILKTSVTLLYCMNEACKHEVNKNRIENSINQNLNESLMFIDNNYILLPQNQIIKTYTRQISNRQTVNRSPLKILGAVVGLLSTAGDYARDVLKIDLSNDPTVPFFKNFDGKDLENRSLEFTSKLMLESAFENAGNPLVATLAKTANTANDIENVFITIKNISAKSTYQILTKISPFPDYEKNYLTDKAVLGLNIVAFNEIADKLNYLNELANQSNTAGDDVIPVTNLFTELKYNPVTQMREGQFVIPANLVDKDVDITYVSEDNLPITMPKTRLITGSKIVAPDWPINEESLKQFKNFTVGTPLIEWILLKPDSGPIGTRSILNAKVSHTLGSQYIRSVQYIYTLDGTSNPSINAKFNDQGLYDDTVAGDGIYTTSGIWDDIRSGILTIVVTDTNNIVTRSTVSFTCTGGSLTSRMQMRGVKNTWNF